jgi:AcrR family transcriptional regulator
VRTTRPRTKPPEERRDELMNAARRLFLEQGVGPTTIEQITTAADVAKGTFYLHFSSKEDIRAALGERFAEQHLAKIKTALAEKEKEDWPGKLAIWAESCAAGYLDSIRLHDILFYGAHAPTREGLVNNIVIDHLAGLLQAGVEAGAWSLDDPRFTAVFLFSGVHAAVDDAYDKEKRVNRSRLALRLRRLCFRALGLPSGEPLQRFAFVPSHANRSKY